MTDSLLPIAKALLRQTLGSDASFREGQWEAIAAIVEQRQRLIVVQRTGWGKSLVYFIATHLNRRLNRGITLLISPLLSLMRNQIQQAERFGLCVKRIDSTNPDDYQDIKTALLQNKVDLLLISPERLANTKFRTEIWSHIRNNIGLLVIDEVHCISDWGHDFRPNYRRVLHILTELPPQTPVLGTTATANTRVIEDVKAVIGGDVEISRGSLMRESLHLYTYPEPYSIAYRLVLTSHLLRSIRGTGIIYCSTTRDCEIVTKWLQSEGFRVEAYHSRVDNREALEHKLLNNEVRALVASVALGMGFDKPDLSFVIHFQLPGSIISYYQQIGRAGRGIDNAYIILMHGQGDREIQEYFIDNAFPPIETIFKVAHQFISGRCFSEKELEIEFNLNRSGAEKIIQQLEIAGFIKSSSDGYYYWTQQPIPNFNRWAQVTAKRYQELEQMEAFATSNDCLMQFLADALEDPTHPQKCGRCKNCRSSQSKFVLNEADLVRAQDFLLRGEPIWIEPKQTWGRRNIITERAKLEHFNERGLALSFYNDEGWGKHVKAGKYTHNRFNDELVNASAELIQKYWRGKIGWVTNIPSTRHPNLVPDFARRLAQLLKLPYQEAVYCANPYPEQKTMKNSYLQLQNIANAFEIKPNIPSLPVLLVDDIIDSGWSLTLVGWLLREQNVPQVFPFVLAKAMANSD